MPIKSENYKVMMDALKKLLGAKCVYCGSKEKLQLDHINPSKIMMRDMSRSKREWHYFAEILKGNIQLLCYPCNLEKGDRVQIYFTKENNIL